MASERQFQRVGGVVQEGRHAGNQHNGEQRECERAAAIPCDEHGDGDRQEKCGELHGRSGAECVRYLTTDSQATCRVSSASVGGLRLGRACLIAGRSGISGSVTVGDNVMMGGGVGLADHLVIGDGARLAAGSGFMTNVPAGEVWAGYPAQPMGQMMREIATVKRLARRKPSAEADNG